MRYNVIYDDDYKAVDIIDVPDKLNRSFRQIYETFIGLKYQDFDEMFRTTDQFGNDCIGVNTDLFVKWVNERYCRDNQKIIIIEREVPYCAQFPTIDF